MGSAGAGTGVSAWMHGAEPWQAAQGLLRALQPTVSTTVSADVTAVSPNCTWESCRLQPLQRGIRWVQDGSGCVL